MARHAGLKVGALSLITNAAAGMGDSDLSHDHVMANAAVASQTVSRLLKGFLANSAA